MANSTIVRQLAQSLISSQLTLERLKSVLLYYVLLKYVVRVQRHLAARGIVTVRLPCAIEILFTHFF